MNKPTPASLATPEKTAGLSACGVAICNIAEPACALFYEAWHSRFGAMSQALGKKVKVTAMDDKQQPTGKNVVCELRDTLPHEANAGDCKIELNAPAFKALGAKAGVVVYWEFVE